MHELLARQLRDCFGSTDAIPDSVAPLISLVDAAYRELDQDRRMIGQSMEATSAELESKRRRSQQLEAIGLLAGGVAHDFNNLLTVIGGYLALFGADAVLNPQQQADINEVRAATERAATLTRQLLAFGRKQVLHPAVLDLNVVTAGLAPMLERLLGEDVTLEITLADRPALTHADPAKLEQVLMNLVINARDAMPQGGRVSVSIAIVDLRDERRTQARGGIVGPHVLLSISDTGVGIAEEHLGRIFEPFFTTKPVAKGTGLGLSTVYGIVRQSGGIIDLRSSIGVGTTFDVLLPSADEKAVATPMPLQEEHRRRASSPAIGSKTILVVEDDDAIRSLITRVLQRESHTIIGAKSGREALTIALDHRGKIDLVVTDVVMPEIGGPQLAQHLQIARPDTPVLYISGYADDEVNRRGGLKRNAMLVEKPFNGEELTRAVNSVLRGAAAVGA